MRRTRLRSGGESVQEAFKLPVCDAALTYTGQDEVQRDIANLKAAMEATGTEQAFMCSIGPASCSRIGNTYYKTDEEFVYACAEAMHEEYLEIVTRRNGGHGAVRIEGDYLQIVARRRG